MTAKTDAHQQLGNVADALVESLMAMSGQELMEEVRERGEDADALARQASDIISNAILRSGKAKLAAARAAYSATQMAPAARMFDLAVDEKRRILERFAANDQQLQKKLTLAARKGGDMNEGEMDSFLRDLWELGAIDDEGRPK